MVSSRCKMAVKEELKKLGLHFIVLDLGEVEIMEDLSEEVREQLKTALLSQGLELMDDKRAVLMEQMKRIITDSVLHPVEMTRVGFSTHLSEMLGYDYAYLAALFSEVQGVNIEQYVIALKIERIKELVMYGTMSLTEISYEMNYSSVAHLSNQFKNATGLSPTRFKQWKDKAKASSV